MRQTKQKEMIKQEINSFSSFFNAEELYNKVMKMNKSAGIATVYRFLNSLVKNGEIHSYTCDRKTIYSNSKKNHCHFTCEKCGEIEHIDIKKLDFLKKQIKGEVCHFQIDVTGICEKCLSEEIRV